MRPFFPPRRFFFLNLPPPLPDGRLFPPICFRMPEQHELFPLNIVRTAPFPHTNFAVLDNSFLLSTSPFTSFQKSDDLLYPLFQPVLFLRNIVHFPWDMDLCSPLFSLEHLHQVRSHSPPSTLGTLPSFFLVKLRTNILIPVPSFSKNVKLLSFLNSTLHPVLYPPETLILFANECQNSRPPTCPEQ